MARNENIVDGSEIRQAPVEVGSGNFSHFSRGFIHPNGGWEWDFFHQQIFPPSCRQRELLKAEEL